MNQAPMGFKISPFLQEHMCRSGSKLTFEEAADELSRLLRLDINAKQVERLCHCYGEKLDEIDWREAYSDAVQLKMDYPQGAPVYFMVDGSMVLTREEKWKEVKLGRIFSGSANVKEISKGRGIVAESFYCAHLGQADEFWERFSTEIPYNRKLVSIGDGALWIWNYITTHYPGCIQILDYYHCKEHVFEFANKYFGQSAKEAKQFVDEVMDCFINKKVKEGIEKIRQLQAKGEQLKKQKSLIKYLTNNENRIEYGSFLENGYLIGSGAIEAAHRNIIQKRLKLSGQRWTKKGAQQVVNLRVCEKSNQWDEVVKLIKNRKLAA